MFKAYFGRKTLKEETTWKIYAWMGR